MTRDATETPSTAAVVVAAGRGARAGGAVPKQYALLAGLPVVRHTVLALRRHPAIDTIAVVIHPEDRRLAKDALREIEASLVTGGESRQESVFRGLKYIENNAPDRVLVHDAARPFLDRNIIDRTFNAMAGHDGAVAGIPVADTLQRGDDSNRITETVDRKGLWRAQTPQVFDFGKLLAAHQAAAGQSLTDDAAVAALAGMDIVMATGADDNFKITTPADMARAARMMVARHVSAVGQGYDVHAFAPGDHLWLCGVRVPHDRALKGHSDADVALHALTDAIYGAIGEGDIGQHFPDSDPQWKGAPSGSFLSHAIGLVAARGGRLVNVDITIVCEQPRLAPHRAAMLTRLAELTGLPENRIGLKATTTEKLGFTGRGEGVAAQAIASVSLPETA